MIPAARALQSPRTPPMWHLSHLNSTFVRIGTIIIAAILWGPRRWRQVAAARHQARPAGAPRPLQQLAVAAVALLQHRCHVPPGLGKQQRRLQGARGKAGQGVAHGVRIAKASCPHWRPFYSTRSAARTCTCRCGPHRTTSPTCACYLRACMVMLLLLPLHTCPWASAQISGGQCGNVRACPITQVGRLCTYVATCGPRDQLLGAPPLHCTVPPSPAKQAGAHAERSITCFQNGGWHMHDAP